MSYDVLRQVEKDFSERAQWNSFLTLIGYKNFIRDSWFDVLKAELNDCFAVRNIVEKWGYISLNIWDCRWFINEFGKESLCLSFDSLSLRLWANRNVFNIKEITSLLSDKKFIPIVSAFERQDVINGEDNEFKIIENGNFLFDDNDSNNGHYNHDQIAWYAKYKTKDFVEQIERKVDRFRKNDVITELFVEINRRCKIG
jgi:hypothetical protein